MLFTALMLMQLLTLGAQMLQKEISVLSTIIVKQGLSEKQPGKPKMVEEVQESLLPFHNMQTYDAQ